MAPPNSIGEFEQLVLLAVLRLGDEAYGIEIRRELHEEGGRRVSRGSLYNTLERLGGKDMLSWEVSESSPERGGLPRRRFKVTPEGIAALKRSRDRLLHFWSGLEKTLGARS